MRFLQSCLGVCLLTGAAALFAARPAVADSYSLYTVSSANSNVDRAIYDDGTTMVYGSSCGVTNGDPCYKTYDHGTLSSVSATQPSTAWDNGFACSFSVAGYQTNGLCNGNYHAFSFSGSDPLAQVMAPGLYAGALDDPSLVYGTSFNVVANLLLNSHGDVAFTDKQAESIYQAYNTTPTPEPGALLLLGTGLGMGLLMHRRLVG